MDTFETEPKPKKGHLRKLSPEITDVRDRIVERFIDAPLKDVSDFVAKVLATEKNHVNRVAALAARVVLIRNYVNELMHLRTADPSDQAPAAHAEEEEALASFVSVNDGSIALKDGMQRVKIIEDSTVNGVSFPKGVVIDVKIEDGERLIAAQKAELVDIPTETTEPSNEAEQEQTLDVKKEKGREAEDEAGDHDSNTSQAVESMTSEEGTATEGSAAETNEVEADALESEANDTEEKTVDDKDEVEEDGSGESAETGSQAEEPKEVSNSGNDKSTGKSRKKK